MAEREVEAQDIRARDGRFDRSQPREGPGRGASMVKPEESGPGRSDHPAPYDTAPHPAAAGLWERFLARENLAEALRRVEQNAGAAGIDGMGTKELRPWLKDHWPRVRSMLDAGAYRPSPVRRVMIPKPSGGRRMLGVPTVVDRLICQALSQVLAPVFDPYFHPIASVSGRGARLIKRSSGHASSSQMVMRGGASRWIWTRSLIGSATTL
jgi:RNA-directed DNA polymerase